MEPAPKDPAPWTPPPRRPIRTIDRGAHSVWSDDCATRGGQKGPPRTLAGYGRGMVGTTMSDSYLTPEARARRRIDEMLTAAGWLVQDYRHINRTAASGVAVREFPLNPGHGRADYMLFVDGVAAGVLEAKKLAPRSWASRRSQASTSPACPMA